MSFEGRGRPAARFTDELQREIGWTYNSSEDRQAGNARLATILAVERWEDLEAKLRAETIKQLETDAESATAAASRVSHMGRDALANDWRVKAHVAKLAAKALTVKP